MGAKAKLESNDYKFVDYDIILVCSPLVLFGSKLGTIFNIILPNSIILLMLTIILIYYCIKTYNNAKIFEAKEQRDMKDTLLEGYSKESFEITFKKEAESKKHLKKSSFDSFNSNKEKDSEVEPGIVEINVERGNDSVDPPCTTPSPSIVNNSSRKDSKAVVSTKDQFNLPSLIDFRKRKSSTLHLTDIKDITNKDLVIKSDPAQDEDLSKNTQNLLEEDFDKVTINQEEEALTELISKVKEMEIIKSDILNENSPIRPNSIRTLLELVFMLLIAELLMGSNKVESIIGIESCSLEHW
eukprot:CAMPEP_0170539456 /NCGR_PEP_ID=MMETSP0209-20121228/103945_1 /TAXON_ID=665100 ORGANISM="Litonotus pictus, Strain P1" /NCGR_SAMPLE_ID=MMETSP0209 /ASSEMBLY_ACC=CAM_ASM_000301 /LENGTH=297 /DNA_ID=CAMNT_0010841395 /DNA_START=368 /DNA_END=1258 /DNA_ORIENTATION=+